MSSAHATLFAPAERAAHDAIIRDAASVVQKGIMEHVTRSVPCLTLILNKQRQAVYVNDRMVEALGARSPDDLLGKRPGEMLHCVHACETAAGCGTTAFCRYCGAAQSILQAQASGLEAVKECRIDTTDGHTYDFRVWTTPIEDAGDGYTVFSLIDIADEKRRHALERTFFHDVNDMLTVVTGFSQLLQGSADAQEIAELSSTVEQATEQLADEIASHWKLLQAEKGQLAVSLSAFKALELVRELQRVHARRWHDWSIIPDDDSEPFQIETDRALLRRVLNNMLKNAVEASQPGEAILIGCRQVASNGVFWVHNPGHIGRAVQLQMFQRSFSTKGEGRGIGTYSMRLFGEQHLRGKVWFTSTREEGTTFYISLPLSYHGA